MLRKNKNKGSESFSSSNIKKMLGADSTFIVKEAYNSIRTNLMFTEQGEKCPVFVVTSPTANNGKTINSINLAISYAQMGKRTLLIDADMRNPTVHRMFEITSKDGLSEILAGLTDSITVSKTTVNNLSVLTAGKIPPNPAELLASPRLDKLLQFVKEHYDCVFIDTPPINLVTDATIFAKKSTGYILIVKEDTTDVADVKFAVSSLDHIDATIVGFLLNDVNSSNKRYYPYYRKYNYHYKYNYKYKYNYDNYKK